MLQPKRTKFRKQHKMRNRGLAHRGNKVSFGEFGLQATSRGRITARQIEAGRRAINRHIKRGGKVWIRIFPDKPITKKPLDFRMVKGMAKRLVVELYLIYFGLAQSFVDDSISLDLVFINYFNFLLQYLYRNANS
jgi:ribosomal protein L16